MKLSDALPGMMEADQVLSSVFDILQKNLALLKDRDDSLTPEQLNTVVGMWKLDGTHVKLLLDTVDGLMTAEPEPVVAQYFSTYPIKPAALRSHQLASTGGRDK